MSVWYCYRIPDGTPLGDQYHVWGKFKFNYHIEQQDLGKLTQSESTLKICPESGLHIGIVAPPCRLLNIWGRAT